MEVGGRVLARRDKDYAVYVTIHPSPMSRKWKRFHKNSFSCYLSNYSVYYEFKHMAENSQSELFFPPER